MGVLEKLNIGGTDYHVGKMEYSGSSIPSGQPSVVTLNPNKYYDLTTGKYNAEEGTTINLDGDKEQSGVVNEFIFRFKTNFTGAPTINYRKNNTNQTINWVGGTPSFIANHTYEVSIVNGFGVCGDYGDISATPTPTATGTETNPT